MKYRDREELENALKIILKASSEQLQEMPEDHITQEIRKIRRMEEE